MHESIFSYNLTRPYPYKWFTPVVLIIGTLATGLVTLLSMATSGYEMTAVYSYNPNATEAKHTYFSQWPSFLTANTKASCAATTISTNSNFYTNNTAFAYTLRSVWRGDAASPELLAGSLPYQNNPLRNCTVQSVGIDFNTMERTGLQIAKSAWGASLEAFVTCVVDVPEGVMNVNLSTTWDYNPADASIDNPSTWFTEVNQTSASLWWGESLMAWYYLAFMNDTVSIAGKSGFYKGYAIFNRTVGLATDEAEIESLDFFSGDCYFFKFSEDAQFTTFWCGGTAPVGNMTENWLLSEIWTNADSLAKAMYFTILADLGQKDATYPNILADTKMLEYYSANISDFYGLYDGTHLAISYTPLATGPFTAQNASNWQLGIQPSVISTAYLCQQPQQKQGGSLIIAILVADLVLLQAIWTVFKMVVDSTFPRRHMEIQYCAGCKGAEYRSTSEVELIGGVDEASLGPSKATWFDPVKRVYQRIGRK